MLSPVSLDDNEATRAFDVEVHSSGRVRQEPTAWFFSVTGFVSVVVLLPSRTVGQLKNSARGIAEERPDQIAIEYEFHPRMRTKVQLGVKGIVARNSDQAP